MNKPSTLLYEDFKKDLASVINNSNLPAFVIELVLQDYLSEVKAMALKQYQLDKAEYETYLQSKDVE